MAVNVMIGRTNKRINSTSQTFADSTSLDCRLKEPCSQQNPVFIVQGLSKTVFYNFAKFLNHYYWIDDIVYLTNDVQEVHCHLDPLATYKGAIENSYAYVQYGDAANWNKWIDDVRISPELEAPEYEIQKTFDCIPSATDPSNGWVVFRYMDTGWDFSSGDHSGIRTAACSWDTFMDFDTDSSILSVTSTLSECVAALGGTGSWRDNLISAVYVPSDGIYKGAQESQIRVGNIDVDGTFYMQNVVPIAQDKWNVDISGLWSQTMNEPFVRSSRWMSLQISTPLGCTEIPIDLLRNQSSLQVVSVLDMCSGDLTIKVTDDAGGAHQTTFGTGACLAAFNGNIGLDMLSITHGASGLKQGLVGSMVFGAKLGISAFTLGSSMGSASIAGFNSAMLSQGYLNKATTAQKLDALNNATTMGERAAGATAISSGIDLACGVPTGINTSGLGSGGIGSGLPSLFITNPKGKGSINCRCFRPFMVNSYTDFCDMYGYPVNYYLKLSSCSGFIKCSGASVQGALGATEANKSTINSYLNSGFYLEA